MVKYSTAISAALLVAAAVSPVAALPAKATPTKATPAKTPTASPTRSGTPQATPSGKPQATSSAKPQASGTSSAKTPTASEQAANKSHVANSHAMLEWVLKEAIKICHKSQKPVLCLETLGSFYFQESKADEDKAVQLEGLIAKFEPSAKPPPGVKKPDSKNPTSTKNPKPTGTKNPKPTGTKNPGSKPIAPKKPSTQNKPKNKRAADADAFTQSLNALTDGKDDATVKKLKQGSKRDEDAFTAELLGNAQNDPVVSKITKGKRAVPANASALALLKRMKTAVEDICGKMKKENIKDVCYMKIGSLLFAANIAPEDKATNLQGLITQFNAPKGSSKRELANEMQDRRDLNDELEVRDFDDEFEARDFDDELYGRNQYLDLEDLD